MSDIFFYSILIFILLSIFVPSIYNYAYSCFIGRIVLVLLIIYFSKHNVLLGLVFVAIIIITSMPLYEGFLPQDMLAKNMLVTSNYSIKDNTDNKEVFDHITKYYCSTNEGGLSVINTEKQKRWSDILNSEASDNDSRDVASANIWLQNLVCGIVDTSQYHENYNNNLNSTIASGSTTNLNSVTGCSTQFIDENAYCSYWANVGECSRNPGYMLYRCSNSCNRVSGNTATGTNYVFNTPVCLSENIQEEVCNNDLTKNIIPSAVNVSNNPSLDPYFQQDGQWMQNMYSQLCEKTSPVI